MLNLGRGFKCITEKVALNDSLRKWQLTSNWESGLEHETEKVVVKGKWESDFERQIEQVAMKA